MATRLEEDDPAEQGKWGEQDAPREGIKEMQREWEQMKQRQRQEHEGQPRRSER